MRRKHPYPSISSYAGAKRVYESIRPIRGTNIRPLGYRSKHNSSVIEKDGDNYIIKLYHTDVVTYRPDGSVVLRTGGWHTQSTAQAIDETSPYRCRSVRGSLVASCSHGSFFIGDRLEFDPQGKPVDPTPATIHKQVVNRAKAKQVRKYFAAVPGYIRAFQSAFAGGTKPEQKMFVFQPFGDTPLSDEGAIAAAWLAVPEDYNFVPGVIPERRIIDLGEQSVTQFWKDIYDDWDVVEEHTLKLPYGVVK